MPTLHPENMHKTILIKKILRLVPLPKKIIHRLPRGLFPQLAWEKWKYPKKKNIVPACITWFSYNLDIFFSEQM